MIAVIYRTGVLEFNLYYAKICYGMLCYAMLCYAIPDRSALLPDTIVHDAPVLRSGHTQTMDQIIAPRTDKHPPIAVSICALTTHRIILEVSIVRRAIFEQDQPLTVVLVLDEIARISSIIYIYRYI